MRDRKRRHDDAHYPLQGRGKRATKRKAPEYTGPMCGGCLLYPAMMTHLCDGQAARRKEAQKDKQ